MSKRRQRRESALEEIAELKAKRRLDVVKCAGALAAILIAVAGRQFLESSGIVSQGSMALGAAMMMVTIGLAIVGGMASIDFTKNGQVIRGLQARNGITAEDIKNYGKGN